MISLSEAIEIHDILIERFGGAKGIRDMGLLQSALARPYQTFDGKELYPNTVHKAAALAESLLSNHPFIDGNKRIGYVWLRLLLMQDGMDIAASQSEKYAFVIQVACSELDFEGICAWLDAHLKKPTDTL
jgi:death-on-curing protein